MDAPGRASRMSERQSARGNRVWRELMEITPNTRLPNTSRGSRFGNQADVDRLAERLRQAGVRA